MLKYNDSNIYGGYIKQLLTSFNLPQCPIGKKDFYRDDFTKTYESSHYIEGNTLYFYDAVKDVSNIVSNYKENDAILNITKNLEIRSNLYDSYTHEYLGDYLRYIRDYKKLDLMSMYNCFSNVVANINITSDSMRFVSKDDSYTIFAVPIKFKQKYTIAIDWHGVIEVCCGFYKNGKRFVSPLYQSTDNILFESATYKRYLGMRFNHPELYDMLSNFSRYDYANEKDLKMFIKIPNGCKSSIVILEGDYADSGELIIDDNRQVLAHKPIFYIPDETEDIYDSNTASTTFDYRSQLQLLSSNSGETYLLADRLVEYLSNQAINPLDPVINNIKRLQTKILKEYNITYDYHGIWDEKQRKFIYMYIVKNGLQNKYKDLLAYLDKDVERTFDIEYIVDKEDGSKKENDTWLIQ